MISLPPWFSLESSVVSAASAASSVASNVGSRGTRAKSARTASMATDIAKFTAAIDKSYKTFLAEGEQFETKDVRAPGERERQAVQHLEQRFHKQLQRARAAFLQEFRNHSVVVEAEVRKIREELAERLEEKNGAQIRALREQVAEEKSESAKLQNEILRLRTLVSEKESYTAAMKERLGLDKKEELRAEVKTLREELESLTKDHTGLSNQLSERDDLVAQLQRNLAGLEGELKRQAAQFAEERCGYEEKLRGLHVEMQQQRDQFQEHLKEYEERFLEYRAKTAAELQIQEILNTRRSQALVLMEEERRRHIRARVKPTPRIGVATTDDEAATRELLCEPYELAKDSRYRVDDMGMDTSWRDYQPSAQRLLRLEQKQQPSKARAERGHQAMGPNLPTPTELPRLTPR